MPFSDTDFTVSQVSVNKKIDLRQDIQNLNNTTFMVFSDAFADFWGKNSPIIFYTRPTFDEQAKYKIPQRHLKIINIQ